MTDRPSRTPRRNRLAKPLPERWRQWLVKQGVPRRKYTAVVRVMLAELLVENVVIEEGWIIATDLDRLAADRFEQVIDFDPERIESMELVQVV
jgi:hypothetical protein